MFPCFNLLKKYNFQKDYGDFWPWDLTLKMPYLCIQHSFYWHDIKISFEYVDFYAKMSLILDTRVSNWTIQQTISHTVCERSLMKGFLCPFKITLRNNKTEKNFSLKTTRKLTWQTKIWLPYDLHTTPLWLTRSFLWLAYDSLVTYT